MEIEFDAIVYKIQTMPDHGYRLVLDTGEDAGPEISKLMTLFRDKALKVRIEG